MVTEYFPDAVPIEDYVKRTHDAVLPYGLASENTLAMVGVCRDELTWALGEPVRAAWGPAFVMGSMAGMLLFGATGLRAAMAHAPGSDGRQRFVVYAMPHVGIDTDGVIGSVNRPGQGRKTPACGALMAFRAEMTSRKVKGDLDPYDLEMSLMRQRLLRAIPYGNIPGVVEFTRIAAEVILEDLMDTASQMPEWAAADVAVFTGIQIHSPAGDYVAPGHSSVRLVGDQGDSLTSTSEQTRNLYTHGRFLYSRDLDPAEGRTGSAIRADLSQACCRRVAMSLPMPDVTNSRVWIYEEFDVECHVITDLDGDLEFPLQTFSAHSGTGVAPASRPGAFPAESEPAMRNIRSVGAVLLAVVVSGGVSCLPAHAAAVHHDWDWAVGGDEVDAGAGLIEVCNHSGYLFNVYADGPSIRKDDLAGSFDECTHWAPVRAGHYDIGFGLRSASVQDVIIQARFQRGGQTFYKLFDREGVVAGNVGPGSATRVDLFIPQG